VDASLKRFASREIKLQTSDLDKLQAKLAKLDTALKAGLLTTEQHKFAVDTAEAEAAGKSLEVLNREIKTFADQQKRLDATPLDRLKQKQDLLTKAVEKGKLTQQEAGVAAKRHQDEYQRELDQTQEKLLSVNRTSKQATEGVQRDWSQLASASKATAAVVAAGLGKLFHSMREDSEAAARNVESSARSFGELGAISDAAGQQQLIAIAKEYFASGAVGSQDEANKVILGLADAQALGDRQLLADMQRTGLMRDPGAFAKSARMMQQTLGESEAGTVGDLAAQASVAQQPFTTTAEKVLEVAANAGVAAEKLGASAEELMAVSARMLGAKGDRAFDRVAILLSKLTVMPDLQGQGILGKVEEIGARKLPADEMKKLLGDEGAVEAFGVIQQHMVSIREEMGRINAATRETVDERIARQLAIPDVAIAAQTARERNVASLAGESRGQAALLADAVASKIVGDTESGRAPGALALAAGMMNPMAPARLAMGQPMAEGDFGAFQSPTLRSADATFSRLALWTSRMIPGFDEQMTSRNQSAVEAGSLGAANEVISRRMETAAERQEKAAEAMERAAKAMAAGQGGQRGVRPNWSSKAQQEAAVPTE
jgi:hypothetical protein